MRALPLASLIALAGCGFDVGGVAPGNEGVSADAASIDHELDGGPDLDAERADAMPAPLPPGTLVAPMTSGAVVLDGNDAEFVAAGADAEAYELEDGVVVELHDGYTGSARVRFSAIHDAANLYFFAAVTDASYQVDSTQLWNDDGISIYLDAAGDAAGPFGADDHELVIRGDAQWADFGPLGDPAVVTVARSTTAGGYNLEVRVTKASLSAPIDDAIGFDLAITDDDGWVDSDYDGYSAWFASSRPTCATCCTGWASAKPWCDTTLYGTLRLE